MKLRAFVSTGVLGAWSLLSVAACGGGSDGDACTPGQQVACACPGGGQGAQVCADDGSSFGTCDCGGGAPDAAVPDVDAAPSPDADLCEGHLYYAGKFDNASSVWATLPGAAGLTGVEAGDAQCAALNVGADHVCTYEELAAAQASGELAVIPQGTSFWLQRTTTVTVGQTEYAAGPGANCNNWTFNGNHLADGEYVSFDQAGVATFHFDPDPVFDAANPGVHVTVGDIDCGGVMRSLPCCYAACAP